MRTKVLIGLSLIGLLVSLSLSSCQNQDMEKKIRKVDSLIADVKEAENTMVIDISAIKARYDTIQRMDSFIENHYNRKPTKQFSTMMNQYKAIESNYKNFIKNYEIVKYENEKHRKRLKDLKKDLVEGNISNSKFKDIYKEEQQIIKEHLKRTKDLVRSITRVEKQYRRTHEKVAKEYRQLKKVNS